jgi:hypothetical protein
VCRTRIELAQQEPSLRTTLVRHHISGNRVPVLQQFLSIHDRGLEELFKVFVAFLILVVCFSPLSDGLSVENKDMEEGVEEEDNVVFYRDGVEEDGMGISVEAVRHEGGLDHDERVVDVGVVHHVAACQRRPQPRGGKEASPGALFMEGVYDSESGGRLDLPVESSLVWRIVEDLQELTSPKVEHELRINREIRSQGETRRILLSVLCKLLTQTNQHPIQPPKHIGGIINLGLEDCDSGHQDCCCFLVEGLGDSRVTAFVERSSEGGDSESELTGGVLVVGYKLDQAGLVGLKGLTGRCHYFKVGGERCFRGKGTDLPGGGLTNTDLGLANAGGFLVGRDDVADDSGYLELFCSLPVSSDFDA